VEHQDGLVAEQTGERAIEAARGEGVAVVGEDVFHVLGRIEDDEAREAVQVERERLAVTPRAMFEELEGTLHPEERRRELRDRRAGRQMGGGGHGTSTRTLKHVAQPSPVANSERSTVKRPL